MAQLATIAPIAAAVLQIGGGILGAVNEVQAGAAEQEALNIVADQEEAAGTAELAGAQRQAQERVREGQLVASRALAVAAASGGGAGTDAPSVFKILTDIGERTAYGAETEIYNGLVARKGYFDSAAAKRKTGANSYFGSFLRAGGALGSGIGSALRSIPITPAEVG